MSPGTIFRRQPLTERNGVIPGNFHDGMIVALREAKIGIPDKPGILNPLAIDKVHSSHTISFGVRPVARFLHKFPELASSYFMTAHPERLSNPHPMLWPS